MRLDADAYRLGLERARVAQAKQLRLGVIVFDDNDHPRDIRGRFRGKGVVTTALKMRGRTHDKAANLAKIATDASADANKVARKSPWHGEPHWKDVARYAVAFAQEAGGDSVVAFLFGALHDTKRENDYDDPGHGPRAADWVDEHADDELSFLSDKQIEKLMFALDYHDAGQTTTDPTIGACWDADRVTLWRVGISPAGRFMSTPRAVDTPGLAKTDIMKDDLTWTQIARGVDFTKVLEHDNDYEAETRAA